MMKILNPETKAYQKGKLDKFWLRLFERFDSLCKLQLIICPDSGAHTNESLLSPYYKPLKRMYELLSHGVSFDDHDTIKRFQITQHAKNWIQGKGDKILTPNVHSVTHGNINAWQDRFIVSVDVRYDPEWIDDLRKAREKVAEGIKEVFKGWQSEKDRMFNDWFEEERMGVGKGILQTYFDHLRKVVDISAGLAQPTANDLFSLSSLIVHPIHSAFKEAGLQDADILPKLVEYLTSPSLKDVPFIKISALLWAAIARKAAAGQKKPPNQGMVNDIETISVLLPYCDAMFIDNECHTYLNEAPLADAINYGTKIFSLNNREKFMSYLDEIELKAPKRHLEAVKAVYGEGWKEPYTTLYKNK